MARTGGGMTPLSDHERARVCRCVRVRGPDDSRVPRVHARRPLLLLLLMLGARTGASVRSAEQMISAASLLAETTAFPLPGRGRWTPRGDTESAMPPCNRNIEQEGVKFACQSPTANKTRRHMIHSGATQQGPWQQPAQVRTALDGKRICLFGDSLMRQFTIQMACWLHPAEETDVSVHRGCTIGGFRTAFPNKVMHVGNTSIFFPSQSFNSLEHAKSGLSKIARLQISAESQGTCPREAEIVVLGIGLWEEENALNSTGYGWGLKQLLEKLGEVFPVAALFLKPTLATAQFTRPLVQWCSDTNENAFASNDELRRVSRTASGRVAINAQLQKFNIVAAEIGRAFLDSTTGNQRQWTMVGGRYGEDAFMASLLHPCSHIWDAVATATQHDGANPVGAAGCWNPSRKHVFRHVKDGVHYCQRDDGVGSPVMGMLLGVFFAAFFNLTSDEG